MTVDRVHVVRRGESKIGVLRIVDAGACGGHTDETCDKRDCAEDPHVHLDERYVRGSYTDHDDNMLTGPGDNSMGYMTSIVAMGALD